MTAGFAVLPATVLQGQVEVVRTAAENPIISLFGSALGTFLTTLVVGAIMIALAPDYTKDKMNTVSAEPLGSCLYGLVCLFLVGFVTVVLVFSIIGIVVAIPFVMAAILIWAVGSAIAFLTISERLLGDENGWLTPLLLASGMAGGLTLTGIGSIVSLCVGAAGFGAILRDWIT